MSGCANGSAAILTVDSSCAAPEAYPENPDYADLIYALNDTYLAWEECHDALSSRKSLLSL